VSLDDNEIMRCVQAGQVELFDLLVSRYRQALVHVAWSKLGDGAWAEDIVQEALLAAFAARGSFDPRFSFRTWLWTILLNLCRRAWRQRQSRPREQSLADGAYPGQAAFVEPSSEENGLSRALRLEARQQVHQTLALLDEPVADALRLRFFAGLAYDEIALAMGSSTSGAKRRVKVGLARLATLLAENSGDEA
jgi:RNA polymerase sigma-70 factor (ECF subfamily)